jgi:hypothetical protein
MIGLHMTNQSATAATPASQVCGARARAPDVGVAVAELEVEEALEAPADPELGALVLAGADVEAVELPEGAATILQMHINSL